MMVNFFKGYHIFIRPPDSASGEEDIYDDGAAAVAGGSAAAVGRGGGGGGGSRAGQGQESDAEFDVLGYLSFSKADLRPFLRVLLRTKAFAAFLTSARYSTVFFVFWFWCRRSQVGFVCERDQMYAKRQSWLFLPSTLTTEVCWRCCDPMYPCFAVPF